MTRRRFAWVPVATYRLGEPYRERTGRSVWLCFVTEHYVPCDRWVAWEDAQ
jgi:hypothetical protein